MREPASVGTDSEVIFFETFRQRWVTVTTTGNPLHRNYIPHGRGSSYPDHNDPGDCQWNKLKSNCPELSMDEITQIVKAK